MEGLALVLDKLPSLQKVGLKNALAYERSVDFDVPDEIAAWAAWGKLNPTEPERKAFGDCVVDRLCRLAGERDIPFQMHLGSALIRGPCRAAPAHPVPAHAPGVSLDRRAARHGLFVYRNIWIDLTWSWILSPTRFREAFQEAVEVLPDESRMMLGGDTWHAEEAYGAITDVRRLVAESLDAMVKGGAFRCRDAERLALKVLHDNAKAFFGL